MNMAMLRFAGLALAALALLSAGSRADDFNLKVTADNITLGKHVMGPEVTAEDLKHHVVLLEFWGIN
jgi:hypothetical protein